MTSSLLYQALLRPDALFNELSRPGSPAARRLLKLALVPILLPPLFAWIGTTLFGWRLGAVQPLFLAPAPRLAVSVLYALALAFGLAGTVVVARWMARTYGARSSLPVHTAFFTLVSFPLGLASAAHLYPSVILNVLVLIPTLIWCMALLYRGLPRVLGITAERGMLMSSALVGWLLVAAVSLLGLSMGLWANGIGPALGT